MTKKISADAAVQAEDGTGVVAKKQSWHERNPEKSKAISKTWREKNPEKAKASQKAWRDKNKEKISAAAKERRANWTEEQWEAVRERDRRRYAASDNRRQQRAAAHARKKAADPEGFERQRYNDNTVRRFKRTLDDYNAKLAEQGGHCAICPRTPEEEGRRLAWDHDHSCCATQWTCGECVRDLLCIHCNLKVAALENGDYAPHEQYLRRWKANK